MRTVRELAHVDAMRVLDAVREGLEVDGRGAAVAVVDTHGELVAFLRTDGCPLPSVANACNKAFTAARERTESADIGEKSRTKPFPITNFGDLRYTGWGGGIPLVVDGHVVGAVGVSGLPEADDIELARRGAAALGA
jgi:glc operon protein GlcG